MDFAIVGEATYLDDIPYLPKELHGAFVQTTHANAKIAYVDASEALRLMGVVTFVTAADIPGRNSFVVNAGAHPDPVSRLLLITRYGGTQEWLSMWMHLLVTT